MEGTDFSQFQFVSGSMSVNLSDKREERGIYRIVVFPAASRPTIKIRISRREKSASPRTEGGEGPNTFLSE